MRLALLPDEADPPLIVDADRVLPCPIATQRLQPVSRRHAQVIKSGSDMQQQQSTPDRALDRGETPDRPVVKQELGFLVSKRSDHGVGKIFRVAYSVKQNERAQP
ncbi:hypothetical protein J2Y55_004764 [Bosea sp. BE125]|nr:hypothetical protein [Bosea sp. BE125]